MRRAWKGPAFEAATPRLSRDHHTGFPDVQMVLNFSEGPEHLVSCFLESTDLIVGQPRRLKQLLLRGTGFGFGRHVLGIDFVALAMSTAPDFVVTSQFTLATGLYGKKHDAVRSLQ